MIISNIAAAKRYFSINPNFEKVFEFLKTLDSGSEGSFNFEGFSCGILNIEPDCEICDELKLEAHKEYLDIHFVINGAEKIGYAEASSLESVTEYDAENDFFLLKGEMQSIVLNKGDFCITFPEDAHAPGMCVDKNTSLKKAIVKIKCN